MVLYDESSGAADAEILLKLGLPAVVVTLSGGGDKDKGTLELPADIQFPPASDCPVYFIFSENVRIHCLCLIAQLGGIAAVLSCSGFLI